METTQLNQQGQLKSKELETTQSGTHNGGANQQNNTNSSEQLREEIDILGSPFKAVRVDKKWNLLLGRLRVLADRDTFEELVEEVEAKDWELILNIIQGVHDLNKEWERLQAEAIELNKKGEKTNE